MALAIGGHTEERTECRHYSKWEMGTMYARASMAGLLNWNQAGEHHKISQSKVWDYRLRRDRGPMIDMISRYHIGGLDLQYYLA